MHVQVAADVGQLDERPAARRGTAPRAAPAAAREPRAAVDLLLVRRVRQRLQRLHIRGRARRPHQRGPEALRLGHDHLQRHALHRDPDGPPLAPARSPRRSGAARRTGPARARIGGGAAPRTAPRSNRASAARRRPPRHPAPPQSRRPAPTPGSGSVPAAAAARPRGTAPPGSAPPASARFPARSRSRPSAAAERNSSAVRISSACAISTERLAAEPEVAAQAHHVGRQLALQLRELGDLARLDQLAQLRLDRAPDPAQRAHAPGADQLVHGSRRRRGSSPRRAGRRAPCTGWRPQLEQRRERLQPVGDLGVGHRPMRVSPARPGSETAPLG